MLQNKIFFKNGIIFIALLILIFAESCKSTKKIQAAISKKDPPTVPVINQSVADSILFIKNAIKEVHSKEFDYKTFSAKIKVEYDDSKGKQANLIAYVRMIKDSVIWMSVYPAVLPVEAYRVLITKDSVFLIDKINREVQLRSLDYLQEVSAIPFDLRTLQNLIVGNPIYFEDSVVSYKETGSLILMATVGKYFKHLLTINKDNHILIHSKLDDVDMTRNRTADITYGEFEQKENLVFSTYRELTFSEKIKLDVHLNFKQYDFNKELSITLNIPKNFKRK
jgi:hypothetical protein